MCESVDHDAYIELANLYYEDGQVKIIEDLDGGISLENLDDKDGNAFKAEYYYKKAGLYGYFYRINHAATDKDRSELEIKRVKLFMKRFYELKERATHAKYKI